ncbi:hypothetical protein PV328_004126 [Microctonus aethiopoides]|uniref:Uncharacterized protein n=1 Tax=Microctonus aethiopoides TaxID=144406 RepID=A0AA39KLA5_9HYME|nr:hypothetical protein PV328_004126 [Microctonus aethiopoides]
MSSDLSPTTATKANRNISDGDHFHDDNCHFNILRWPIISTAICIWPWVPLLTSSTSVSKKNPEGPENIIINHHHHRHHRTSLRHEERASPLPSVALPADRLLGSAVNDKRLNRPQKDPLSYEGCHKHNFLLREILDDIARSGRELVVAWLDLTNAFTDLCGRHKFYGCIADGDEVAPRDNRSSRGMGGIEQPQALKEGEGYQYLGAPVEPCLSQTPIATIDKRNIIAAEHLCRTTKTSSSSDVVSDRFITVPENHQEFRVNTQQSRFIPMLCEIPVKIDIDLCINSQQAENWHEC